MHEDDLKVPNSAIFYKGENERKQNKEVKEI